MKNIIFKAVLLFLAISSVAFGQSISIFDIDTTNFPTMKAKFYAFDKDGNQVRPSASELSITEDGVPRTITNVSCPAPRRIKLSVGIMVDTYYQMDIARLGTERLINFLDMPNEDELALTYMNDRASIWQDFTQNKTLAIEKAKTIPAAPGVDINTMFYSEYSGGIPFIKDRISDKKVLILVSDLHCPNLNINESQLIADAKAYNISIYSVLLGTTDYSGLFTRIAAGSGGTIFENVRNESEITDVFEEVAFIENTDPCEITWESNGKCLTENINVELNWSSSKSKLTYKQPSKAIASLKVSPSFISFGKISNPIIKDTTITLIAINSDITINDIKLNYGSTIFSIENINFPLLIPNNSSKTVTLRCTPIDSSINYSSFEIETNLCPFYLSANGGYPGKKMNTQTLKLTHPNGGEVFVAGSDTLITWDGISPNDTCKLEFSNDNSLSWNTITSEASNLKYNWKNIPLPTSGNCLIKVSQLLIGSDSIINYDGHNYSIRAVSISNDGSKLASADEKSPGKLIIWDVNSKQIIKTIQQLTTSALVFSPDGSKLFAVGTYGIYIYDIIQDLGYYFYNDISGFTSISISEDGSKIVCGSVDSTARIWDLNTGLELKRLIGHLDAVTSVAISGDGNSVVTGSVDKTIKIWDANTGNLINTLYGHTSNVNSVDISFDGKFIASGSSDNLIKVWDFNSGLLKLNIDENKILSGINCVKFSPDFTFLAIGLKSIRNNGSTKIYDLKTGKRTHILTGSEVFNIAISNDSRKVITHDANIAKIWEIGETFIQSDESDAVFSIIAPVPQFQQLNIDMGQVVVGSSKDTMVTAVLCNIGQAPLHVLGVDVTNGSTNEFMVPRGAGDFFLAPNECRDMMFAFMPNQVGVRNAKITVKSTIGDYIDTINITGTGILPTVQIVNKYIDFGYVDIFTHKDTLQAVTIKNISNVDIDIKNTYHSGPNDKDFITIAGGGAFKLLAGETAKLDMRFLPTSVGRTSGTLMFEYDGIGSPAVVQLFGAGIGGVASLKLDSIETETSKIVEYPVKLTLDSKVLKSGANAVNFDISYNNTLLYPSENYPITNKDGFATLSFKNVPLTTDPIQILDTLRFRTGLGNAIETPLIISNFELLGTTEEIDITLNDGNLKLTDVCYDGGVRLLNPNSVISMTNISPNPVNSIISIELNLIEIGSTEVSIYNLLGEKVKTIFSRDITETGSISINSDLSDLSNGQYVVIFTTPTYTERQNVLILK